MRQNEILKGVDILDENGNKVGTSKVHFSKLKFNLYYVKKKIIIKHDVDR